MSEPIWSYADHLLVDLLDLLESTAGLNNSQRVVIETPSQEIAEMLQARYESAREYVRALKQACNF